MKHRLSIGEPASNRTTDYSDLKLAPFPIDSCAPAHLKLVRFPVRSPLPIAALPSMSLFPKAPLRPLGLAHLCMARRSLGEGGSLASQRLHSLAATHRGFTFYLADPSARFTGDTDKLKE
jgi:hypothetical protein